MSTSLRATRVVGGSAVGFLVFLELTSGFVQGYYAPLLPRLADQLGVSDADIIWFTTVQTLAAAVCVPLLAKLGDMFGHRRMLRIGIVTVTVGSLVVALVPSYPLVLVARVLHGALALWLPLEIAIIHSRATGATARRAVGFLVASLTGGVIIGTVVAGGVASVVKPMWIVLLVPVLFMLVALYAVFFRVPETTERSAPTIDWLGFAGLALAMILTLVGLRLAATAGPGAPSTIGCLMSAVAVAAVWVWWERRSAAPAVDVRRLASRSMGPINVAGFLFGLVMFGSQAPLTTFLGTDPADGYGFGAGPGVLSMVIAVLAILATVGAATFSLLAGLVGMRVTLLLGAGTAAAACVLLAVLHAQWWQIWVACVLLGYGMGVLLGALPALMAEVAPTDQTGVSVGMYNSIRPLGGAVGGALFAGVLVAATPHGAAHPQLSGYVTMWVLCALAFVGAIVAIALIRMPAPAPEEPVR